MKKLLDHNTISGVGHVFHYDETTNEARITAQQDATPIIEENKRLLNDTPNKFGEGVRVAQIPMVVYHDLMKKGILRDQNELRKWLNDPENRFFRTHPGRV